MNNAIDAKTCQHCHQTLVRRQWASQGLEVPARWRARKYCSRWCAAQHNRTGRKMPLVCKTCGVDLVLGQNWNRTRAQHCQYYCTPHWTAYRKLHYPNDKRTPEVRKEQHLQREYQVGRAEWEAIYVEQEGKCKTCGKPLADFSGQGGTPAALDHDHKTGLIRGLLCLYPCNHLLGFTRDNPTLCRAMADYIENPPATAALGGPRYTFPGQIGTKKRRALMKKAKKLTPVV